MSNSGELNQIYLDARKELKKARLILPAGSDERLAVEKSIDQLDGANLKRIQDEFSEGSSNLQALAAELNSITGKINPNQFSAALDSVNSALGKVNTLATKLSDLASSGDDA